jgi:hypothetical protein
MNMPPEELAQFMSEPERLGVLFTDAFRRKTIDHILERIEIVDAPPPELLPDDEPGAGDASAGTAASDEPEAAGDTTGTTDDEESAEVVAE